MHMNYATAFKALYKKIKDARLPFMTVNFWKYHSLDHQNLQKILRRGEAEIEDVTKDVIPIIKEVRKRGDAALIDYAAKFDKSDISKSIKAQEADFERAYYEMDPQILDYMKHCAENVRIHHQQQIDRIEWQWMEEVRPGQYAGEKITPVASAGLYVPRGKGAFPSVMYMLCTAAKIAGVPKIVVCTPPDSKGGFDAASLVAADLCGVRDIYKSGGAQAIAALAYGTQSIPKVDLIEGPGSPYVSAARRLLSDQVNPGMPAGATDSLILADETANANNTALDILNEAEHGSDSASILVTSCEVLARKVAERIPELIKDLPEPFRGHCRQGFSQYGGIMLCEDILQAIEFCNNYAPEHLLLKVAQPDEVIAKLQHAGEILIGENTPFSAGNYGVGVNCVLPTGQKARSYSCTSVWSFLKRISLARIDADGFSNLAPYISAMAGYEGFPAHKNAVTQRKIISDRTKKEAT